MLYSWEQAHTLHAYFRWEDLSHAWPAIIAVIFLYMHVCTCVSMAWVELVTTSIILVTMSKKYGYRRYGGLLCWKALGRALYSWEQAHTLYAYFRWEHLSHAWPAIMCLLLTFFCTCMFVHVCSQNLLNQFLTFVPFVSRSTSLP